MTANATSNASISERGIDEYGTYADLHISTGYGKATQRMRWIEPGTFLMGSPSCEAERWDNEGPQHLVTLTKGFWLADTACTQALWQAVMGNNPSYFRDNEQNPVENVSWNDVQEFLRTIETLLPGVEACLPTEAQWEYACRAGTTTVFSFGNQITPKQANYDGGYPYADGEEGEYRGSTLPVKSLPINAWGLYDMHGNVAEWVIDAYLESYAKFPEGAAYVPATTEYPHVARGGSWDDEPDLLRSAARRSRDASWKMRDPQLPKSKWYLTDAQFLGFRVVRPLKVPPPEEMARWWTSFPPKKP